MLYNERLFISENKWKVIKKFMFAIFCVGTWKGDKNVEHWPLSSIYFSLLLFSSSNHVYSIYVFLFFALDANVVWFFNIHMYFHSIPSFYHDCSDFDILPSFFSLIVGTLFVLRSRKYSKAIRPCYTNFIVNVSEAALIFFQLNQVWQGILSEFC